MEMVFENDLKLVPIYDVKPGQCVKYANDYYLVSKDARIPVKTFGEFDIVCYKINTGDIVNINSSYKVLPVEAKIHIL